MPSTHLDTSGRIDCILETAPNQLPLQKAGMSTYLSSAVKQFEYYRQLGEKAMAQVSDEQLFWQPNADSNSIAIIVQHLWGNMMSRWTDFLTSDGEKEWRRRDAEFEAQPGTREALLQQWNKGWNCLLTTLRSLTDADLASIVYIRNMGQTATDAINRQLCHYGYHVGQITYLAKMMVGEGWLSLSIPKNASQQYNSEKFAQPKTVKHFTDDYLPKKD
jgi:hypothetical protein